MLTWTATLFQHREIFKMLIFTAGNVEFEGTISVNQGPKWFRALCNPDGDSPCCFENKCVSKPLESCRCEHCFDVRQQVHAELSTWVPTDPSCTVSKKKIFVRK